MVMFILLTDAGDTQMITLPIRFISLFSESIMKSAVYSDTPTEETLLLSRSNPVLISNIALNH